MPLLRNDARPQFHAIDIGPAFHLEPPIPFLRSFTSWLVPLYVLQMLVPHFSDCIISVAVRNCISQIVFRSYGGVLLARSDKSMIPSLSEI